MVYTKIEAIFFRVYKQVYIKFKIVTDISDHVTDISDQK